MTTQPSLTPAAFAAKWHGGTTTEKASAHEHFIDLVTDPWDAQHLIRAKFRARAEVMP